MSDDKIVEPYSEGAIEIFDGEEYRWIIPKKKGTIRIKGGKGSGFHGHSGRPGKVGGSTSGADLFNKYDAQVSFDPWGESVVLRGGDIPKTGPTFLTTSAETAIGYGYGRSLGAYAIDTTKLVTQGTENWYNVFGDDLAEEYEMYGMELFTDPPDGFLDTIRAAGYVGYASASGQLIRIEQEGSKYIKRIP